MTTTSARLTWAARDFRRSAERQTGRRCAGALIDVPKLLTLGAMPRYEARWSWSGNLAMSNDTARFAAVLGDLDPRVGDPHALTPANKGIAKTPPGTSVIDVEVRPR